MSPEEVFKYRYERLSKLIEGGQSAQLLDVAQILRQMLIDSPSIVDIVNQNHRLKVEFEVFESTDEQIERVRAISGLTPSFVYTGTVLPPFAPKKMLKKDSFLAFKILYLNGQHYTVSQVIKASANRLGGVHYSSSSSDNQEESILRKLDDLMSIGGAPATLSSLILVGRIVTKALAELYSKTNSQLGLSTN
jgi:hypothetical protein